MASVATEPNGRRRIQFSAPDGKRKTIRLGEVDEHTAETICGHVEAIIAAADRGEPIPRGTSAWLRGLGDSLHKRIAAAGLTEPRADRMAAVLGPFVAKYIESRRDAKPRTILNLERAKKALVDCFGEGKPLARFTAGDADNFRLWLLGKGMAENTIRRLCGRARQFFGVAVKRELIDRNPFAGLRVAVGGNPSRSYYVTAEEAARVLDACPSATWRAIFSLEIGRAHV